MATQHLTDPRAQQSPYPRLLTWPLDPGGLRLSLKTSLSRVSFRRAFKESIVTPENEISSNVNIILDGSSSLVNLDNIRNFRRDTPLLSHWSMPPTVSSRKQHNSGLVSSTLNTNGRCTYVDQFSSFTGKTD